MLCQFHEKSEKFETILGQAQGKRGGRCSDHFSLVPAGIPDPVDQPLPDRQGHPVKTPEPANRGYYPAGSAQNDYYCSLVANQSFFISSDDQM
jgi:hypothetical protein